MKGIIFNENNVRFKVHAETWMEAIAISANVLVENGCAMPSYVNGIISSIQQYGPYIIISKGFAIPHSRPEDGAIKVGFSLVTFDSPIYFEGDKDPVNVMICFSALDSQTHLDILKMIVEFVEKGYIEAISKMDSIEELLALVKE